MPCHGKKRVPPFYCICAGLREEGHNLFMCTLSLSLSPPLSHSLTLSHSRTLPLQHSHSLSHTLTRSHSLSQDDELRSPFGGSATDEAGTSMHGTSLTSRAQSAAPYEERATAPMQGAAHFDPKTGLVKEPLTREFGTNEPWLETFSGRKS